MAIEVLSAAGSDRAITISRTCARNVLGLADYVAFDESCFNINLLSMALKEFEVGVFCL